MANTKHILVIRFSALGDVAMTVPVVKAVLSQNPDLHITYVSRPLFEGLFNDIPRLRYIAVDLNNNYKGLAGIFRLFKYLQRTGEYDELADLHHNLRSKIIRKLFRFAGDVRDKGHADSLDEADIESGTWGCDTVFKCVEACPKRVRPTDGIEALRRETVLRKSKKFIGVK